MPSAYSRSINSATAAFMQQEQEAMQEVNQQAAGQDVVGQQMQAEQNYHKELANQATQNARLQQRQAAAQKAQVNAAERAGVKTVIANDGSKQLQRHENDGGLVYEHGFQGEVKPTPDGHAVDYRTPRGTTFTVPTTAIRSVQDEAGVQNYEFDVQHPDGTKESIRQPVGSKPLWNTDPQTGKMYTGAADPETGSYGQTMIGVDPQVASKAAIERQKALFDQQQGERRFKYEETGLIQHQKETALKPIKDSLAEAKAAAKKLAKENTQFKDGPDGLVQVVDFGAGAQEQPIPSTDTDAIARARAWIEQKKAIDQKLADAQAAHDPLDAEVQTLQQQREQMALDTLRAGRASQLQLLQMEKAHKAGIPVHEPDWQKRVIAARADPRVLDIFTKAELEQMGGTLGEDVVRAGPMADKANQIAPESVKVINRLLTSAFNPRSPLLDGEELPPGPLRSKDNLLRQLTEHLAADNEAPAGVDAKTIAMQSLGIKDPEKWQIQQREGELGKIGYHDLSHEGVPIGTVNMRDKRIELLEPGTEEMDAQQQRLINTNKAGLPVYYASATGPLPVTAVRDMFQQGMDLSRSSTDPAEVESKLAAAKMSPSDIRQKVLQGQISVQDGRLLNETFHGLPDVDASKPAVLSAFGKHLTSPVLRSLYQNGDREAKAGIVNDFMNAYAQRADSNIIQPRRSDLAAVRAALLTKTDERGMVGKAVDGVLDLPKQVIAPLAGMVVEAVSLPYYGARKALGYKDEEPDIIWNSSRDLVQRQVNTANFGHRLLGQGPMKDVLSEVKSLADKIQSVDDVPDELDKRVQEAAYDGYHRLTDQNAQDVNTTRDHFSLKKDPALRAMMQKYLSTADGAAFDGMLQMLSMTGNDRATQMQTMKFLERPRTATADNVMERAKLLDMNLDAARAAQVLDIGKKLDAAKDATQYKHLITQAGKVLGLDSPADAQLALGHLTREETDDPDSWRALFRAGTVADVGELATEIASDVTTGVLTASIMGAPAGAALKGAQAGARQGLKQIFKAPVSALRDRASKIIGGALDSLAEKSARFANGRTMLRQGLSDAAARYKQLGIATPAFGAPLTTLQKGRNAVVGMAKSALAAAPIEAVEEGAHAVLEAAPTPENVVDSMVQGALGGTVLVPMFAGAGALSRAWGAGARNQSITEYKAGLVDKFNARMAGQPNFTPLTVDDFDVMQGIQDNPLQQTALQDHAVALQELAAAQEEHTASVMEMRDAAAGNAVAEVPPSPRLIAAQAAAQASSDHLTGLASVAFSATDELRALPPEERPLYTGVAKAVSGATDYTESEAQALMGLGGPSAIAFQQAQVLPADVAGPAQVTTLPGSPPVTQTGLGHYRLPPGVRIQVPQQAIAALMQRAPSLTALLDTTANQSGVVPPLAQSVPPTEPIVPIQQQAPTPSKKPKQQTLAPQPQATGRNPSFATLSDEELAKRHTASVRLSKEAGGAARETWSREAAAMGQEIKVRKAELSANQQDPAGNTLPIKAVANIARATIGAITAKSPQLKKLINESKKPNPYPTGGMWMNADGTILYHLPTLAKQLVGLDPKTTAQRVAALLDEEIRHAANMNAAQRLWMQKDTNPLGVEFEQWRDAWYSDIWHNHFTEEMRAKVAEAYGSTLPEQDWVRAMEGLRMLDQLRATGSITESVLHALDAVLAALREFLNLVTAGSKPIVQREIDAIAEVLQEFGYENGAVQPSKAKRPTAKAKTKKAEIAPTEIKEPDPPLNSEAPSEPPHIWKGTRNGKPTYILYRAGAGQYAVQIGKDQTLMPEANAARMSRLNKQQIQALPDSATPPPARIRTDLNRPTVQVGDWISDANGSSGPVVSIMEDGTPVMGMEGENEGEVEPQAAVGGWKIDQNPYTNSQAIQPETTNANTTDEDQNQRQEGNGQGRQGQEVLLTKTVAPAATAPESGRVEVPSADQWQKTFRAFKRALSKAVKAKDYAEIIQQADAFQAHYENDAKGPFPDSWSDWERHKADAQMQLARQGASDSQPLVVPVLKPTNPPRSADSVDPSYQQAQADVRNALGGLFSAPAFRSIPQLEVPAERFDAVRTAAVSILAANIRTPEAFARFMDDTFPGGKARPYSEAIWDMMGITDKSLRGTHNWSQVYAAIETPLPAVEAPEEPVDFSPSIPQSTNDETQPGIRADGQATEPPDSGRGPLGASQSGQRPTDTGLGAGMPNDVSTPVGGEAPDGIRQRSQRNSPPTGERTAGGLQGEPSSGAARNDSMLPRAGTGLAQPEHTPARSNYWLSNPESIVGGGAKARFGRNKKALETLEALQEENRDPTPTELDTLAAYTGWGAFGQELFKGTYEKSFPADGWGDESEWLKQRLGKADWESAQESILNAHYTDPPTVSAMWDMIERMGFKGGRVLEPSLGTGNFFSLMPRPLMDASQLSGIELDPTTAAIAKFLHPQANIRQMGYEESTTGDNFYDLIVGNWPFKKGGPADRRYNHLNASLHDFFFVKAIDQVRPGGLVVGITSAGTMDKKSKAVRSYLAARGELVAAFRLPTGAFGKYAGTNVVTDIVILRKRETPLSEVNDVPWVESVKDDKGRDFSLNAYYQTPEGRANILGELAFGSGSTYGRPSMIVKREAGYENLLPTVSQRLPAEIIKPWKPTERKITYIANTTSFKRQNAIVIQGDDLYQVNGENLGLLHDIKAWKTKDAGKRLADAKSLLNIRSLLDALTDAYRAGGDITPQRSELLAAYQAHIQAHGPLNKSRMLDIFRRAGDPTAADILNLEEMTANGPRPRAILTQDIMRKRIPSARGSIADAYALARNNSLDFRVADVATAAGVTEAEAQAFLVEQGQIYRTPQGVWQPSDIYLAGNVRQKLREAEAAQAEGVEGMERNITALKAIQPADTPYYEIEVQMGASWVPIADYQAFIGTILQANPDDVEIVKGSTGYNVKLKKSADESALARSQWGTEDVHPSNMFTAAMNGTSLKVYSVPDKNGVRTLLPERTELANQKRDEIREQLVSWLWSDPIRTARLVREYNEAMNAVVTPRRDGSHLRLEGLALTLGRGEFDFRQHQRDAVWRFLLDGKGVGAHEVGTGKTFTIAGLAMEGRRLGVLRKPMILAHNANSSAIAADISRAYPASKVLYLDDLGPAARENALRQIKLDDWDAVVVPHSLISRFGLKHETMMRLVRPQIEQLENEFAAALEELPEAPDVSWDDDYLEVAKKLARVKGSHTAKELMKRKKTILEDIEKRAQSTSKEGAISFEDLGVDAIIVDEAHIFKKIPLATRKNFKGLQKEMSGAGFQLQLITDYLKSINSGKGVFLFTGTPVTNTLNEVFNMMRFVMGDELKEAQIDNFDDWFNSFAQATTDIELTSGGTFEPVERVLSFINIPELARLAGRVFDVVRANDMPEFKPRASDEGLTDDPIGRPRKLTIPVVAEMSPDQGNHKRNLETRYREYQKLDGKGKLERKKKGGDVPIKIETDGRKSALDHRLFDAGAADFGGSKINLMVGNIMEHYREHPQSSQMVFQEVGVNDFVDREKTLRDADGRPLLDVNGKPRKSKERVTTYNLLRDMVEKLVDQGVKPEEIAVFHNMSLDPVAVRPNDVLRKVRRVTAAMPKEQLAAMMNRGEIRVAFGSTQTMGTGVNAQEWLRAMHHLDAPWTPGEFEQRNGRGWRQGNRWNTVMEYRYFTEGSHDGKMWQTLLNKVRFIERFTGMLQGKGTVSRVLEGEGADTSEDGGVSDFEQSFSSAAGDPRLLVRAKLEKEVQKLQRRRQVFINSISSSRDKIRDIDRWQERDATNLPKFEADHVTFLSAKDPFTITINGKTFTERKDATDSLERLPRYTSRQKIGAFGSFNIYAESNLAGTKFEVSAPSGYTYNFEKPSTASLEATLGFLKRRAQGLREDMAKRAQERASLEESLKKPWSRETELVAKEKALEQIRLEIAASPMPAPPWLRLGAPSGSLVYVRNADGGLDALDVAAHRWDANDYWLLIDNGADLVPIRYSEALTETGSRLFQDYEFQPPGGGTLASAPARGYQTPTSMLEATKATMQGIGPRKPVMSAIFAPKPKAPAITPRAMLDAYRAAKIGQSSDMVPIKSVFEKAKAANPALEIADFMQAVKEMDDGRALIGLNETNAAVKAAMPFVHGPAGVEMTFDQPFIQASTILSNLDKVKSKRALLKHEQEAYDKASALLAPPDSSSGQLFSAPANPIAPQLSLNYTPSDEQASNNAAADEAKRSASNPLTTSSDGSRGQRTDVVGKQRFPNAPSALLSWAKQNGWLIETDSLAPLLTEEGEVKSGDEHDVWFDAGSQRAVKVTIDDQFVQGSPFAYAQNLARQNELFNAGYAFEGIADDDGKPRIVTSQPWIVGKPAEQKAKEAYFASKGFDPAGDDTFYSMGKDLLVTDAKPANVIQRDDGSAQPIDVQIKEVAPRQAEMWENRVNARASGLASAPANRGTPTDLADAISAIESNAEAPNDPDYWPEDLREEFEQSPMQQGIENNDFGMFYEGMPEGKRTREMTQWNEESKAVDAVDAKRIKLTRALSKNPQVLFTPDEWATLQAEPQEAKREALTYQRVLERATQQLTIPERKILDETDLSDAEAFLESDKAKEMALAPYLTEVKERVQSTVRQIEALGRHKWDNSTKTFEELDEPQVLYSAPAQDEQKAKIREILASMNPTWRNVLEDTFAGKSIEDIAKARNLTPKAVSNIFTQASGRFKFLMKGTVPKVTVQVENGVVKAKGGRPDLALSGNALVAAVDQRRQTPEEVTHAEMQELATRMFAVDPVAAEKLVTRWMDSGTTVLSTAGMPEGIQTIVDAAQAQQSAEMLMTAAAKMLVSEKAFQGGNSTQLARLIDLYRNTGTEQARALNMRRDPFDTPEERAAMYLSETLLTPPPSLRAEIAKNPGNKEKILAAWATKADKIKADMLAAGIDLDATFREMAKEKKLAEQTIPESVKAPLARAPKKTRQLVKAVLEGKTWQEAMDAAGMTLKAAKAAYNAFRKSLNDIATKAAAEARDQMLRSAPAQVDFAAGLGLPEWTDDAVLTQPAVKTEATEKLKKQRDRKKAGGEIDLKDPLSVNRVRRLFEERKSSSFDKISEYWRASILSGPQTHVVNIVSGLTYGTYEATFKKMAAGAQADIARMFGFKPDAASLADIPAMLAATYPAIQSAFLDGIKSWKSETGFFDAYATQMLDDNGVLFKEGYSPALKGKLGKVMRGISFRLMGAADEFVKSFFTRIEVAAQARQIARNEGHTGLKLAQAISELMEPGSLAWERALAQAKRITFQDQEVSGRKLDSPLQPGHATIDTIDHVADLISRTKKGDHGRLLKGLAHFTFPFVATPTNIFKAGVTMSPVGGLLGIIDALRSLHRRQKGNVEEARRIYNAARALDDITNQIVAWSFIIGLGALVKPGDDEDELPFITGTIPWRSTSPGERENAYRTAPPQSIRIGNHWYSYKRLDPFASALSFTIDAIREFQSGKPLDEVWGAIGMGMLTNMQDKTFLQGVSDLVNAVQDPQRFGTKWATNIAIGFVPNLGRQPVRTGDQVFRENDLPNDMGFWEVLGRRVGFGMYPSENNPIAPIPAVDVWGREAAKNTGTGGPNTDWLLRLFSPVDVRSVEGVDPLDVALLRYNMTHDEQFGVTAPSRELQKTIGGKPVKISLTDPEYLDFVTKAGKTARAALGDRYSGRDLTETDVDEIKEVISKVQALYRNQAFAAALQKRRAQN